MRTPLYSSEKHFATLYTMGTRAGECRARTRPEWKQWQKTFLPQLREALGLTRMAEELQGHRLRARRKARTDLRDFIREEWVLWVEPTVPLPFYVLRPKGVTGPLPLVVTPHGHNPPAIYVGISQNARDARSMREGQRDIAVQAVREGYLAIAPTTRGFGDTRTTADRRENKFCSCRIELMHNLLVGRTPIGVRCWDMARLIDWALAHEDVDARRIAITGNSGGGTISLFAGAVDERIAVVVPSGYFCTFAGSIGTLHHCDCNYIPGLLRLGEMADVAGLIAPRAFCAIVGQSDPIFPVQHARASYRRLRRIYALAGAADRCRLYVGAGGHRYYSDGSWPFIRQHFDRAME